MSSSDAPPPSSPPEIHAAPNPLRQLNAAGQSVWYDYIHRAFLNGDLVRLIQQDDLRGITSNPTIFDQAISSGHAYDTALREHLRQNPGQSHRALFFALAIEDIQKAADQLHSVYLSTAGQDGYVSLEVSPDLAHDAAATIREAHLLYQRVNRPNVMIKVPATPAGVIAIEALIAEGISVNVTLLFSLKRYQEVVEAYLRGLEQRLQQQQPIDRIASVASFFVSRLDTLLDPLLTEKAPHLQGKIAIANAKLAYQQFQTWSRSPRFLALAQQGAHPQRLLWASTGTKNPAYSDVLYVEQLIGPQTVTTLPPTTYTAFRDHGQVRRTLDQAVDQAHEQLLNLAAFGIDLDEATARLEEQGVAAFAQSFNHLLNSLEAKLLALAVTA